MHCSASLAPAPDHVRFVMFTPVTDPLGVSVIAALTDPASAGFTFKPYSL
jgi:hypothetical protein